MQPDALYIIKANAPMNTEMYAYAKVQMINGKIKLLIDESQAKATLMGTKAGQAMTISQRNDYLKPYVLTTVLREQLCNLAQENEGLNIILKLEDSKDILMLNDNAKIILPNNATFDDLKMNVVYDTDNVNAVAKAEYTFNGNVVGYADILLNTQKTTLFEGSDNMTATDEEVTFVSNQDGKSLFLNIKIILISLVAFVVLVTAVLLIYKKIIMAKRDLRKKKVNKSREKDRIYRDESKHKSFKL